LVALKKMRQRLPEDRDRAEQLAAVFRSTGLFELKPEPVKINMFFLRYRARSGGDREQTLVEELNRSGVRVNPPDEGWIRIVTHHDISDQALQQARKVIETALEAVG